MPLMVEPSFLQSQVNADIPYWAVGVALGSVTAPLLVAIRTLYNRNVALGDRDAAREARAAEAALTAAHALDQLTKAIADQKAELSAVRQELADFRARFAP